MGRKRLTLWQKLWRTTKKHNKQKIQKRMGTGTMASKHRTLPPTGLPVDKMTDKQLKNLGKRDWM